jgi:glycosyltransferase involved in cell wall biosynthesis
VTAPQGILVLHDSLDFGGHERAFLTWLPGLLGSAEVGRVTLAFPEGNEAFAAALAPLVGPKLRLRPSRFVKRRAEPFLAPFRLAYQRWVRELAAEARPDVVLLLQGRIESLAAAMLAVPPGPELVSYLPMAHSGREMGRWAAAAWITDGVKRAYYRRPVRFIAPSSAVADQLRRAGARGKVHIVRNVPERTPAGRPAKRPPSSSGKRSALFLGRMEVHQKGLDLLLRSIEQAGEGLRDYDFHFVGDGPDVAWLHARLAACTGLSSRTSRWTDDPGGVLSAADLVLMPSRYEGVPLVLLEALAARVPVLASPIDVFREHLPAANLFAFGGPGLPAAMDAATSSEGWRRFQAHAARMDTAAGLERSRSDFLGAVLGVPTSHPRNLQGAAA